LLAALAVTPAAALAGISSSIGNRQGKRWGISRERENGMNEWCTGKIRWGEGGRDARWVGIRIGWESMGY